MLTILFGLALTGSAAASPPGPCALLSDKDIAAVQTAPVVSRVESAADGRQVENRRCFFQTDPFARSVSLEWTRDHETGGARRRWDALFHPAADRDEDEVRKRAEREEHHAAPPRTVAGVGDEAFWVPSHASGALYVFATTSFLRISVGGPGTDSEKREAATALARRALAAARPRREGRPR